MADVTFNRLYAGYVYKGAGTVYHRNDNGRFSGIDVSVNDGKDPARYVATGLTTTASDGATMIQIEGEDFYNWIDLSSGQWQRGAMATVYSQSQAQDYVNRMIGNNKQILMNNLFCARFAHHLTDGEKQTLYDLEARLYERNSRLLQDGYVSNTSSSEAYGYGELSPYLKSFMAQGVGLVISTTAIVISCVVIASLATAAYFAYKYYWEQSAKDVKYSDKLTRTLMSKLTAEEYQQLMEETKGIVTKSTIKARLGNSVDIVKYALIGFAAYTLYQLITNNTRRYGIRSSKKV